MCVCPCCACIFCDRSTSSNSSQQIPLIHYYYYSCAVWSGYARDIHRAVQLLLYLSIYYTRSSNSRGNIDDVEKFCTHKYTQRTPPPPYHHHNNKFCSNSIALHSDEHINLNSLFVDHLYILVLFHTKVVNNNIYYYHQQCEMAVFLINICKFNGCGIKFDSLGELITHIENIHIGEYTVDITHNNITHKINFIQSNTINKCDTIGM